MGKETVTQIQEAQSLRQNKSKEENTETCNNQTEKIKDKEKYVKATRKKQQIIYKGILIKL